MKSDTRKRELASFAAGFLTVIPFFFSLSSPAAGGNGAYAVQTATYYASQQIYARKHLETVSRNLEPEQRPSLRIERRGRFLVVKVGNFQTPEEAERIRETLRKVVPGAMLVRSDGGDTPAAKAPHDRAGTTKQQNPSGRQAGTPQEESLWTVLMGPPMPAAQTRELVTTLGGSLGADDLAALNIEKVDRDFSVRMGQFRDRSSAEKAALRLREIVPGATVMRISGPSEDDQQQEPQVYTISGKGRLESGGTTADTVTDRQRMDATMKDISALYGEGNYGKAAELLRRGIEQWPDNATLRAWYAASLLNMQFPDKALEQYRKAAELSPDVPDYHAGVGVSLTNIYLERAKESIDAFAKALKIDPGNTAALEGLGFVYASIGRKDQAMDLYNRLAAKDQNAAARLLLAISNGIDWGNR
jgi:Arc/MetJ-type ribon-helix-helix transcriptional regulator